METVIIENESLEQKIDRLEKALEFDATEYMGMFTFAPELKNSVKILTLIGKFTQGN